MANCAYTFTELDGKQQTLVGIPALKAYLVNGGLEQFFPDRSFPWGGDAESKPEITIRYSRPGEVAPRFYSALKKAFSMAPKQVFGNPEQIKSWLAGNAAKYDVKKDEIFWSGINDWLDLQTGKVSRDDVQAFMDANGVRVKDVELGLYSGAAEKALKDRQALEMLEAKAVLTKLEDEEHKSIMSLPDDLNENPDKEQTIATWMVSIDSVRNAIEVKKSDIVNLKRQHSDELSTLISKYHTPTKHGGSNLTLPGGADYQELVVTIPTTEEFKENDPTHFGDVGQGKQIAWIRHNTRTDVDGNTGLFLEEVQSQRGAEGRREGFSGEVWKNAFVVYVDGNRVMAYSNKKEADDHAARALKYNDPDTVKVVEEKVATKLEGVPPAPFVTDSNNKATNAYISLLMKKAVSRAIDDGKNFVAWTTGDQQADRYDLSSKVELMTAFQAEKGLRKIEIHLKPSGTFNYWVNHEGVIEVASSGREVVGRHLSEVIGKEITDNLLENPSRHTLSGEGLRIGGAWTQTMYGDAQGLDTKGKPSLIRQAANELAKKFGGEIGQRELLVNGAWELQPALIITPAMREKILNEGMPLFSKNQAKLKNTFRYSQEAEDFLVSQFGTGVKNLVNSKTLNFTHGKSSWPEGYRGDEEAVYYNNKAYIDLDATNKDRLKPVLLHEIGEHHNLKKILGTKNYTSLINQITAISKKPGSEAATVWAEVKRNYTHLDEGSEAFVSEVIAKLGEINPKMPWYRRLLAQIKAFLVTHGLGKGFLTGTMGESDLHALLVASLRSAARGKTMGESTFFGEGLAFSRDLENKAKESTKAMPETININGKERATRNSNGQLIHSTEEGIRNFYDWFGDSEVVDDQGRPRVVYHGSSDVGFTEFNTGNNSGIFFTDRFDVGASYAGQYNEVEFEDGVPTADDDQGVYAVYLKITTPAKKDWGGNLWVDGPEGVRSDDYVYSAKRDGNDGVIIDNINDVGGISPGLVDDGGNSSVFVVFDPTQIKSATGNNGDFSPDNADIRYSKASFLGEGMAFSRDLENKAKASTKAMPETINIDGKERATRNSNGRLIHSTEEGIRNFYDWFGDSKVVDDQGRPLVVYHGTSEKKITEFSIFNPNFFTADKKYAEVYAVKKNGKRGVIMPLYLAISNPFSASSKDATNIYNNEFIPFFKENHARISEGIMPLSDGEDVSFVDADNFFNYLRRRQRLGAKPSFDGLMVDEGSTVKLAGSNEQLAYVPLDIRQIKSATGNNGDFSPGNADIRYSKASILDETPEASDTPAWKAWSLRVLDKLSIQTDRVASQSLGFLSAKQITEVAQHYLPYAKEYTNLKDLRQGKIDGVLHSTGKLDDVWKNLPKVVGNRVSKLMQDSTLIDATAAKDWTGVEALNNRDEDAPKYLAYTQAKLPENTQVLVKAKAESLGARTIGKDQATFMDEKSANEFVAFLRTKELAHEAFLKATGHGAEYVDRKTKHAAYQAIYKTLPKEAHEVYNGVHTESQKMRNEELDTVEGWINEAVIDVNRREQLKSELRQKFESNNLMWYYQPLSRFGDYWFSGVTSKGEKYFTTFESERGRNQALKEFEQLGGRANGAGKSIKGLKELSQSALSNSLILDVNQEIEAADISLESKTALQDAIYQMYLKSLPDVSMRHKSMNRKGIQGFSEDARRTFAHASHHGASQIANMIYGRKMEKVLKDCSDAIEMMSTNWQVEDAKQKLDAILVLKGRNLEELWGKDYLEKKRDEALANRDDRQASVYTHAISFRNRFKHADLDASIEGLDNLRMHIEHLQEIGSKLTRENSTKATNVVNELSKTFVDMMTAGSSPADRIAMAAKQAGFSWMLGFGLSSGVVNMLQNPIVAGPVIGSKYGHAEAQKALWNSAKLFASVAKDVFHKDADGKFDRRDADGNSSITVALQEQYANDTTLSGAERQLIKDRIDMLNEFKINGKISRTQTMDQIAVGQVGSDQTSSLAELSKKMGWMFHHGERFNREITLDAAYTLARRDGMDSEAAMAYAGDVVDRAHGDYDAANAARIFRGPVASVAFQFKKYPQMMLFLWGKAARDSLLMHTEEYKKLPAGSPERAELEQQVKEARKLLVGLFTLQAVVGGAVGLPLMGTLEILINALAPDDEDEPYDFEKEVRSGLTAIGGEFLATALMEGIVNAATPINLSSRISLKNVFFQEPLKELEGREAATEYLGQMAGPFGGIVKKLWEGASLISEGNVGRGVEQAAPKFMGDVIKSFRFFNEDARSMNDQKLKEMSSAEIMAQIMGFSSSSLEVKYAERGYVKSSEAAAREYRQKLTNKAARAKMEGSPLPAEEIRAWNAKHPNWKITSDTVKRSITTTKKYEKASGSRGYAINDKLDYLYDEYDLTDE